MKKLKKNEIGYEFFDAQASWTPEEFSALKQGFLRLIIENRELKARIETLEALTPADFFHALKGQEALTFANLTVGMVLGTLARLRPDEPVRVEELLKKLHSWSGSMLEQEFGRVIDTGEDNAA